MKSGEAQFTKEVMKKAKEMGWKAVHFRPGMMVNGRWMTPFLGDKGFPDILMVRERQAIAAELKMPGREPADAQYEWLLGLAMAGVPTTLWSPDNWEKIIQQLKDGI